MSELPGFNPEFKNRETENAIESARIEIIGDIDPSTLSKEEFEQKAWLFHGARNPNFQVTETYDYYGKDYMDDATLGTGLYTTTDKELATNYASTRPNGTLWKLMPFQARMLNLTSRDERMLNLTFPRELLDEWIDFAQPQIFNRAISGNVISEVQDRLIEVLSKMEKLPAKNEVDLRKDILGTGKGELTVIDDIWKEFCQSKGFDGLIFVEGGDGAATRKNDRTYVFYNSSKIGTFEDWQRRKASAE